MKSLKKGGGRPRKVGRPPVSRRYHKVGSQTTKDAETGPLAFQDSHARKYDCPIQGQLQYRGLPGGLQAKWFERASGTRPK